MGPGAGVIRSGIGLESPGPSRTDRNRRKGSVANRSPSRLGDSTGFSPQRPRRPLHQALALTALSVFLISAPALAQSVLVDAAVVAGGSPELQNASGTVRLVEPEIDGVPRVIFVPEPGFLWQLVPGLGLLSILHRRRRISGACRVLPDAAARRMS